MLNLTWSDVFPRSKQGSARLLGTPNNMVRLFSALWGLTCALGVSAPMRTCRYASGTARPVRLCVCALTAATRERYGHGLERGCVFQCL